MNFYRYLVFILVFAWSCSTAKKAAVDNSRLIQNLQQHVSYLADDKLEGRRAGTEGERLAREYIRDQFELIGLKAMGSEGYFQAFEINDGRVMGSGNFLNINDQDLQPGKDYFVFPYSPDLNMEALPSLSVNEAELPWFFDLKEALEDNKENPHYDLHEWMVTHAKSAKLKGASAMIYYNSSGIADNLSFNSKDRREKLDIPVLYVSAASAKKYFSDPSASLHLKLKTDIDEKKRIGHNVIGYIDNRASKTVVIGAHFDHLGYGEDGNSMIRNAIQPGIHNGADDNASGTAALIELARLLNASNPGTSNYLFIAFSGEELGLYGSKFFTTNPTIDFRNVNYMINMDMVGRLNDSSKTLTVGGYGTSPQWGNLINTSATAPFSIRVDSSGTGPSDHTSFYQKNIPVLFFFTGLHSDYHKPTDDAEKINYQGQAAIVNYINELVRAADKLDQKLAFTKTRESQTTTSARFTVSMGIMPDYTYSGIGVKADGVTEGRAAYKAGLKTGDIIIRLGDHKINSLENYMQALGKFKKGDRTEVEFKRGGETLKAEVEF